MNNINNSPYFPQPPILPKEEKKAKSEDNLQANQLSSNETATTDSSLLEKRKNAELQGQCMAKTLLEATAITLEKESNEIEIHIALINNILLNGVLSHARAAQLKINTIIGADIITVDKQSTPKDLVHVNLVVQGKNIDKAIYQGHRGCISIALERQNDNLPRAEIPISKEEQEKIDKEPNAKVKEMMIRGYSKRAKFTPEAINELSDRAHRTVLVITDLEGAKKGFIPLRKEKPDDLTITELDNYAMEGKKGQIHSRE